MVRVIEIDDNNKSNVFKNIEFEAVNVSTKEGDEALADALFEQISGDCNIVLDAGSGNNCITVIKMLKDNGESDNFYYLIPINNSRAQIKNAKDTFDLIGKPEKCIFVLNQVHNLDNVENEFLFFFGSKELGIKPAFKDEVNWIAVEFSQAFELASMSGHTITELAQFSQNLQGQDLKELFFTQSKGNKAEFKALFAQYRRSVMASSFLDKNLPMLIKALEGVKNVAVVSTKGGVGKSTLAWHLITQILKK